MTILISVIVAFHPRETGLVQRFKHNYESIGFKRDIYPSDFKMLGYLGIEPVRVNTIQKITKSMQHTLNAIHKIRVLAPTLIDVKTYTRWTTAKPLLSW